MYGVAVEDCLYHPTCEKNVSVGILDNIETQKMFRPTNCVFRKLPLNFGLALKIKKFIHCKHYGSVTLICSLLWGSIWVITRQSNLKCQGNYSLFHN